LCRRDEREILFAAFCECSATFAIKIFRAFDGRVRKGIDFWRDAMKLQRLRLLSLIAVLAVSAFAASKSQTFAGEVSDAMCGAKHMMPGNAACLRTCVSKGANYALVVGDKVYTLHTADETARKTLDKLAGEKANVTGTADGDTIEVSKVGPAK